ncbi:hypothetical protein D3C84_181680 [compost metagenome]
MLVFVDGRQVDRAEALDARGQLLQLTFPLALAGLLGQVGQHRGQVVAIFRQLILEGLAPHAEGLPVEPLLLELATQQLRLLLRRAAALLGLAQLAVGVVQGQARQTHLLVHLHAPLEQLLETQALLEQRLVALLEVEAELLAALDQAGRLQLQALQRLAGGVVLGAQRADAHRQLMGVILVLAGLLAHPVEALAQRIAAGQQLLALLGVAGHGVQRVLQVQARLAELLHFQGTLLGLFGQLFLQAATAQGQLLVARLIGRQPSLELAQQPAFLLDAPALLLAHLLLTELLLAQLLQALVQSSQGRLQLFALGRKALQLLAAGQQAALRFAGAAHAQEMPADPVAVTTDQAVALGQAGTPRQRLVQRFDRAHAGQPGGEIDRRLHLVQQAGGHRRGACAGTGQAQLALGEVVQGQVGEVVEQHRLQIGAEHGFHRQLPTRLDAQAFGQARACAQLLLAQPLGHPGAGVQRRLLQRFQRGDAAVQALQLALGLLLLATGLLQLVAQLLQTLGQLFLARLQAFQRQLALGQLLGELFHLRRRRIVGQLAAFVLEAALALDQAFQTLLQLLDARLLHLRLAARLGTALVEAVPLLLPGLHGAFRGLEAGGAFLGGGLRQLLLGLEQLQLLGQAGQLGAIATQMGGGFLARLFGFAQVVLQLAQALLAVLDALLHPGDIAAHGIEAALHEVEAFGQLVVAVTQALDAGVGIALFGHQGLEADLLIADHRFALADLLVQRLPAQGRQLSLELAFFGLVFLILLRRLGLAVQALQLAFQLFTQVAQARQVLVGAADAVLGLAAALLVLGDAGGFLDEVPQILGLGLDQLGDHPLLDDRVAARTEAGAEEDVGDVAAPALGAVEEVGVLRIAGNPATDGDLVVAGVFAGQGAVGVVEHQFDAGLGHRLAGVGAVEDDVGHRLATEVLRRTFAHHPAHGVDDVGLAAAVGADHRRHVAREVHRGRVDEGLEARQANALQAHGAILQTRRGGNAARSGCREWKIGEAPLADWKIMGGSRSRVARRGSLAQGQRGNPPTGPPCNRHLPPWTRTRGRTEKKRHTNRRASRRSVNTLP